MTVLERAPAFREGGQNVDVRGVAREVLDRMGLVEAVRRENTTETGTVIVDDAGEVTAELPSGDDLDGDGATAELEVLRGDLARILRDDLPDSVELVYDDAITEVGEGEPVVVNTAAGRSWEADLLVVAEGVRSTTRDLLFGEQVARRELGVTMVFGTIPRDPSDDRRWRWHNTTRGRQMHLRPDNHGTTRAILSWTGEEDLTRLEREDALARVRERYADAGWAAPRILDGFDASDDVYVDHLTQIEMPTWHRGRVVLVGDAAWCVTPLGGGGASLALTSGYVLAAFLAQHGDDPATALERYEGWMRPLVDDVQRIPTGVLRFAYPQTRVGLAARAVADKVLTSRPLRPLAARITDVADTDRELPVLPA